MTSDAKQASSIHLPEKQDGQVWYFAYGSNMNPKVLEGRRKVKSLASLPAKLEGWVLGFNLFGVPYLEPGMATVTPLTPALRAKAAAHMLRPLTPANGYHQNGAANGYHQGGSSSSSSATEVDVNRSLTAEEAFSLRVTTGLHGVLHLISADHWEIVKATEGVRLKGIGYQVRHVQCSLYDGRQVEALTLEAAAVSSGDITQYLPSQRYLNIIREGARGSGLDPAYCAMLERHPAYEPLQGRPASAAKWAMAAAAGGMALPLVPLMMASMTYRRAKGLLGYSTNTESSMVSMPTTQASKSSQDGVASSQHREAPTPGATVMQQPPTGAAGSSSRDGMANGTGQAGGNTAPPPMSTSAEKPSPMFKIMMTMRQNLDPRVMSVAMWGMFRGLWLVHDVALGPVLGSGRNNDSLVRAARSQLPAAPGSKKLQ